MEVRIKVCMVGDRFAHNVGDVVEFGEAEGLRLCDAGYAERLAPETASVAPAKEKAVKPKGKARGSKATNSADD